ncbi:hypothetical protein [Micrococcus luteus]|uniref:hypothetical protein n=1 Tax=Micrococcus luteus TaxID=1270 RepID=UPI002891F275|nr:hypothetical protein [Micrococcus luteus]MDT1991509.1 hypothetical protein [Micrococcus luteus]
MTEFADQITSQVDAIRKYLKSHPDLAKDPGTRTLRRLTYDTLKWGSSSAPSSLNSDILEKVYNLWSRSLENLYSIDDNSGAEQRAYLLHNATRYAEKAAFEAGIHTGMNEEEERTYPSEITDPARRANSIEGRLAALQSHLDQLEERVKESSSLALEESEVIRAETRKRLIAFEENLQTRMAAAYEDSLSTLNAETSRITEAGKEALAEIKSLRDDTKTISQISAGKFVSESYNKSSKTEFKTSLISYFSGAVILVLTLWYLTRSSPIDMAENGQWPYIVNRLTVTAIALTATTVAFKLGSKFLDSSQQHKRLSMDVSAMGPFLAEISDQTLRDAARSSFSERTFSPSKMDPAKAGDKEVSSSGSESQTGLIQFLIALTQASRPEKS